MLPFVVNFQIPQSYNMDLNPVVHFECHRVFSSSGSVDLILDGDICDSLSCRTIQFHIVRIEIAAYSIDYHNQEHSQCIQTNGPFLHIAILR